MKQQATHHSGEGSEKAQLWPAGKEGHGQEEFDHKCSFLQEKPNVLGEMLLSTLFPIPKHIIAFGFD